VQEKREVLKDPTYKNITNFLLNSKKRTGSRAKDDTKRRGKKGPIHKKIEEMRWKLKEHLQIKRGKKNHVK